MQKHFLIFFDREFRTIIKLKFFFIRLINYYRKNMLFKKLINVFITILILRHYNPDRKLRMKTDVSRIAYAGILS